MKYRLILSFLVAFVFPVAYSGEVVISGTAPLMAGEKMVLSSINDYITLSEKPLKEIQIGNDGKFEIRFDLVKTTRLLLKIGYNIHLIYIQPERKYEVTIPDREGEQLYYANLVDTTELSYLVGSLSYEFNKFNANNYEKFIAGTVRTDAFKFIMEIEKKYAWATDPYFVIFKDYKIASLQQSARVKGPKGLFETHLKDKPIHYDHPQYMEFFNEFYNGMLYELANSKKTVAVAKAIADGTPYDTLYAYVLRHEFVQRGDLAELFIIKGLYDLYYEPGFNKYMLESLILEQKQQTKNNDIIKIIDNYLRIINRLKKGSDFIDFEGKRPDGTVVKFSNFINKPVYLTFFTPSDPPSIRELPGVNSLYDQFKKEVNFVNVCSGCTYSGLQDFINQHKLKGESLIIDPQIEQEYEILKYPTAYLFEKGGVFFVSPARLASEGAAFEIRQLTKKGSK